MVEFSRSYREKAWNEVEVMKLGDLVLGMGGWKGMGSFGKEE